MISTGEVFMLLFLLLLLGVGIWAFFIFKKQRDGLLDFRFTRGANATIAPGQNSVDVEFNCGPGKEICVYRATQICTGVSPDGFENSPLDPMSNGKDSDAAYGDFNPNTTVDLTKKLAQAVNGQQSAVYKFVRDWSSKPQDCSVNGQPLNTQLIATYTCYPKGSTENGKCQSWSPKNTSTSV